MKNNIKQQENYLLNVYKICFNYFYYFLNKQMIKHNLYFEKDINSVTIYITLYKYKGQLSLKKLRELFNNINLLGKTINLFDDNTFVLLSEKKNIYLTISEVKSFVRMDVKVFVNEVNKVLKSDIRGRLIYHCLGFPSKDVRYGQLLFPQNWINFQDFFQFCDKHKLIDFNKIFTFSKRFNLLLKFLKTIKCQTVSQNIIN